MLIFSELFVVRRLSGEKHGRIRRVPFPFPGRHCVVKGAIRFAYLIFDIFLLISSAFILRCNIFVLFLIFASLLQVKTILHTSRAPEVAANVPHTYDDKYGFAEFLTNTTLAGFVNGLEVLGLDETKLRQLLDWARKRSVTLRFKAEEKCAFDREEKRKVESSREYVTEYENSSGHKASITDKKVTKITEYFWNVDFQWEIFAYRGNKPDEKVVLQGRSGRVEMKTSTKDSPRSEARSLSPLDCNITYLLQTIDAESLQFRFAINREKAKTPRRNGDVEAAMALGGLLGSWFDSVNSYFRYDLFPTKQENALNMSTITAQRLFVPVVPLFEPNAANLKQIEAPAVSVPPAIAGAPSGSSDSVSPRSSSSSLKVKDKEAAKSPRGKDKDKKKDKKKDKDGAETTGPVSSEALKIALTAQPSIVKPPAENKALTAVLPLGDVNVFLAEQKRSIVEKLAEIDVQFPADGSITVREITVIIVLEHIAAIAVAHRECINYIEHMLFEQLVSAIGKIVTPVDFSNYMRFHNRKLFRSAFEMLPFSYAIRRPDHTPEGTLSIEAQQHDGTIAEPVFTTVRHIPAAKAGTMKFPISAATNVVFGGDRFLHGWVNHQFGGNTGSTVSLVARARQFSSFILLVGRIASATVFEPKGAIIIQNKDELKIPLMMETIPTPKEFRDAIESMSPEQQRFCKAYRAMQLESTLFGVCVIQIKPQLEKLLNLNDDSLTKEIRLTQDLQELFMKYQIPSDLLKFDGPAHADAAARIDAVKASVASMTEMLEEKKEAEIVQALEEHIYEQPLPPSPPRSPRTISPSPPQIDYMMSGPEPDYAKKKPSVVSKLMSFFGGNKSSSSSGSMKSARSPRREMERSVMRSEDNGSYESMKSEAPVFASSSVADFSSNSMMLDMPAPEAAMSFEEAAAPPPPVTESAPAPEPAAAAAAPSTPANNSNEPKSYDTKGANSGVSEIAGEDFTKIPGKLDSQFDKLDEDSALRPTIINPGTSWNLQYQKALLADPESKTLGDEEQRDQKNRAYDLLDALSRSGALSIDCAELHVVIAATHCFTQSLVNTIVADNMNPIEKVERSTLIVASTIHGDTPAKDLIKPEQLERVSTYSPKLFVGAAAAPKAITAK